MKKRLLLGFSILYLNLVGYAQNPLNFINVPAKYTSKDFKPKSPEKKTFAEFKFAEQNNTFDFGTIPEGPKVKHEFKFMNTGNEPLVITNAQASCGCTSPVFSTEPVLPGKLGTITVEYTTEGHLGNFNKSIFLTSNAVSPNGSPTFEIFIKGIVLAAQKP